MEQCCCMRSLGLASLVAQTTSTSHHRRSSNPRSRPAPTVHTPRAQALASAAAAESRSRGSCKRSASLRCCNVCLLGSLYMQVHPSSHSELRLPNPC